MAAGHQDHDAQDDQDDHDAHGSGGDGWVLIPIGVGLVIGLVIAVYFGLAGGASPLG